MASLFRRAGSASDDEGPRQRKSLASSKEIGDRLARILRSTRSHSHLESTPALPPLEMPPDTLDLTSDWSPSRSPPTTSPFSASPRFQAVVPTSPLEDSALSHSPPFQSPLSTSVASDMELSKHAPSSVTKSLPTISIESTSHNVTRRQSKIGWSTSIAERLRSLPSKPVPTGYMSTTDGMDTETEWDDAAFFSSHSQPRLLDISSDHLFSSEDDRVQPRTWTAAEKGKGRAEPLGFPSTRPHTASNASSASSGAPPSSFLPGSTTPPPPVPPLPPQFQSSAAVKDQTKTLFVDTKRTSLEEIPQGEDFVIAIVGPPKCGKSQFVWKGLKCWGLEYEPAATQFGATTTLTRKAWIVAKRQESELRTRFRGVFLEVDSQQLVRPDTREAIEHDTGQWAWPEPLSKIDAVVICYDGSDIDSYREIVDLCEAYHRLQIPAVQVHLKSDLPFQVNPYLSHRCANHYSTGLAKVSTETEEGKQRCRDVFQWLFKCILKQREGRLPYGNSEYWRNPASPEMLSPRTWEFAEHEPPSPPAAHLPSLPPSRTHTPTNDTLIHLSGEKENTLDAMPAAPPNQFPELVGPEPKKTVPSPYMGRRPSVVRFTGVDEDDLERPLTPPDFNRVATPPVVTSGTDTTPKITVVDEAPSGDEVSKPLKQKPLLPPPPELSPVDKAIRDAQLAKKRNNPQLFGTFDTIINKLIHVCVTLDNTEFINTFLITYRQFATPRKVLAALRKRLAVLALEQVEIPLAHFTELKIAGFIERWLNEHPNDFSSKRTNLELMTILRMMVKRTHLLHYATDLLPVAKRVARIEDDPDAAWTIAESEEETMTEAEGPRKAGRHVKKKRSTRQKAHGIRVAVSTTTTVREVDESGPAETTAQRDDGSKAQLPVPPTSPTEDRKIAVTILPSSLTNQKVPKRSRSTLALSYLDSFRSPSRKTINPLPLDADPKTMLRELNKAVDIFLKMSSPEVAEQITRDLLPIYLSVTPRDWLRHVYRSQRKEEVVQPTVLEKIASAVAHRFYYWVLSMIIAPDGYNKRAKVAEHFIHVADALRKHNNYFSLHFVINAIRQAVPDQGVLYQKLVDVEESPWKRFLSMEVLVSAFGGSKAYKLALQNSSGPVLVDLSSHTKWAAGVTENMSAYKPDNKAKINWSKYESQAKIIRAVVAYQKRFDTCDSHAFPERSLIRHVLDDTPILPREVIMRRILPKTPEDGSEHPTSHKFRKFLGLHEPTDSPSA
ncbi:uncharacterized protein EI90DRAFT_3074900 [Cantharellus anzutake]|uniref:uncharacterized protein n=1 Tax=Cantharellus anzutake TaxID=1750568 RepID=UPI001908890E|nr:uncharacterized protein EI90DRAFT_3074900 [Cantharellus anzutake]KAF8324719.1 hypothetical protein EI90DRAFT_3074900 [Cantharellus anzutake]